MNELILILVPSIASSFITWLFSRRKYRAESQANEIENVNKVLTIYRESITDFKQQIDELRKRVDLVVAENEALGKQMDALTRELTISRNDNKRLMTELKKYNANVKSEAEN
ncbi:MAG: hypothetical protein RBS07_07760 [Lentimicrobium sp.]|jgi:uncharacterized coiled-coil DUF342 family protein|nr:hypothetical protein [Lentimicrobium sp.]